MRCFIIILLSFFSTFMLGQEVSMLRCEYLDEPLGIDQKCPRLTWQINSSKPFKQESFRVLVATNPKFLKEKRSNVWDSGIVKDESSKVNLEGVELLSCTKYYWIVEVSNGFKRVTSPIASFETGFMFSSQWQAKWITDIFDKEFRKAPIFRKKFSLNKSIRQARAYVCGIGYYELYINGNKVGDRVLEPGYTHFDKRVLYSTYDITSMLKEGSNAIGALLGNGWMNIQSLAVWQFHNASWRMRPRLLCELHIDYDDGSSDVICTDKTWLCNTEAYVYNNLYSGDIYDARLEKDGWKEANYDDRNWRPAIEVSAPAPKIVSQTMPPIRVTREIKPKSMRAFPDNIYVFDLGENISGFCKLNIQGNAGTKITLKHGEMVNADGRVNTSNIDVYFQRESNGLPQHLTPEEIFQTDVYYLKGNGVEEFIPKFTYHGFRYVELESTKPIEVSLETITGLFVHTDVQPVGAFTCSNDVLNKLVDASRRSYLSNLHSIPTDCPQREKNGWTADAHVAMDLALLNYDAITVYEKWLNDFVDNQRPAGNISGIIPSAGWGFKDWIGPVWDAAMFIIPDKLYSYYGDIRAIENIYPTCQRYLDYLKTKEIEDGTLAYGLGDWVFYKTETATDFTSTAYYYLDNLLMARFSRILGKDDTPYRHKAQELKQKINKKWFNPQTGLYANGTQAGQGVALALGLVPTGQEQFVADKLAAMVLGNDYHLDFGLLGSKHVPAMLAEYGYADYAYKMILNPTAPSWATWIHHGLNTLPETWVLNKDFKDASLNHVFLGDVSAWLVRYVTGIQYDENNPGFRHVLIKPHFVSGLQWAKAHYDSAVGRIETYWERIGSKIKCVITIPANTSATLYLNDKPIEVHSGVHTLWVDK